MGRPNVVGQSGTASAAPVFVTSPPATIRTSVAPAVTHASRCTPAPGVTTDLRRGPSMAPRRARNGARRAVLREVVLGQAGDAVLVRPAVDGRDRRAPVAVRRRGGGRPLERVRLPRVALGPG